MIINKIASTRNSNTYIGGLNNKTSKVSFGSTEPEGFFPRSIEDSYPSDTEMAERRGNGRGYTQGVNSQRGRIRKLREENRKLREENRKLKTKLARLLVKKGKSNTKANASKSRAGALVKSLTAKARKR